MRIGKPFLILPWLLPWIALTGPALRAKTHAMAAFTRVSDLGPQGIFVDLAGHDDNDDVVGKVTFNNQGDSTVHIESLYIHGENITTQGRFDVAKDIQPGEKQELLVILRDVKGKKAKVFVDIHYQ